MSLYTNLQTQLQQISDRIVEITASANPTHTVLGRTISTTEYLAELVKDQKELMGQLQIAQLIDDGPWEVRSFGL